MKNETIKKIIKIIIAVASAILGVLGAAACQ
jgi:hypothetical protein